MEKRRPHHDLEAFKRVCGDPQTLSITHTVRRDAASMGVDVEGIASLVRTVQRSMFVKSMTSYQDAKEWQDVYHVPAADGLVVYLKFRADAVTAFMILSFKER